MATTPFGLATATVTQDGSPPKLGNPTSHDVHPLPWCEPSEPPGAPPGTPQGGYSPNVFVNGKPVHRQGDRFVPHTIPMIPPPPPHPFTCQGKSAPYEVTVLYCSKLCTL